MQEAIDLTTGTAIIFDNTWTIIDTQTLLDRTKIRAYTNPRVPVKKTLSQSLSHPDLRWHNQLNVADTKIVAISPKESIRNTIRNPLRIHSSGRATLYN